MLHTGHRAMLLLIVNEARNDWDTLSDRSIQTVLASNGFASGGSYWVSWYGAQVQAQYLNFNERYVRQLIDELSDTGLIIKLPRPGRSPILVFNTRRRANDADDSGTVEPGLLPLNSNSPRNCGSTDPGAVGTATPEPYFRRSNREETNRSKPPRIQDEQASEVIDDILSQMRLHGRNDFEEVTFDNPISAIVSEQLGWSNMCGRSEFDLKQLVRSRVRKLLNGGMANV